MNLLTFSRNPTWTFSWARSYKEYSKESTTDDFGSILGMMRFDEGHRVIRSWKEMGFTSIMCGDRVSAMADTSLLERTGGNMLFKMVQENKHQERPEAQLIAEGIAAAYENRKTQTASNNFTITIPGITVVGTSPEFYKIPVTAKLPKAILKGQYPRDTTIVQPFRPPVPDLNNFSKGGSRS